MVDKSAKYAAELAAEQEELLKKHASLNSEREKLLKEQAVLHAENEELIQKLNTYKTVVKEFIVSKATMENLNMTSVLDFILYVNEALVACEVGLRERRLVLSQKLPLKYSSLLRKKDYSDGLRLKKAIVRIEKQFKIAEGRR